MYSFKVKMTRVYPGAGIKEAAPLSNRHAMKYRNPVANPGYLSRAAGNRTMNKRLLESP